ncbi:Zn-ribbon domain-containing OB-fold protein [Variovorax sp. M-6]|uniref:Zn-ribbon domain-containing OB-fold protein n=1 Tax=Variovorax sp. M-6 TaxID=3233041 RepID=UPI003F9960E8
MSTPYENRVLPGVLVDAATERHWNAAKEGRLMAPRCADCQRLHWYPRPFCPFCFGDVEWEAVSGRGVIYSVSVTRRAGPVAYAIAYVTLDEGFTLMTNIVDCDLDTLTIGQRVELCFKPAEDGTPIPVFTPIVDRDAPFYATRAFETQGDKQE